MGALSDKVDKLYTVDEFLTLYDEYNGLEVPMLLDGRIFMFSAPTNDHNQIVTNVYTVLHLFMERKCNAVMGSALYLDNKTYVQPDLIIYCTGDRRRFDINNPPLIVIEVLSPSSVTKDLLINPDKCRKIGVCEYWVVSQEEEYVAVYDFSNSASNIITIFYKDDLLRSKCISGLEVKVDYLLNGVDGCRVLSKDDLTRTKSAENY